MGLYFAPLCPAGPLPLKGVYGPDTSRTGVRRHREQFGAFCAGRFGMPFEDNSAMSQKLEFVSLATADGANVSALCRRFGIGRTCAHKLIMRYRVQGDAGLAERSRQPRSSPRRSMPEIEAAALSLRTANPSWGR